jgi:dipeptidyl aminopeptidase/acylaminoacyl peptidase
VSLLNASYDPTRELYAEFNKANGDLWVLNMDGDRKPVPFLQTPFNDDSARFSPDGKWIAFLEGDEKKYGAYGMEHLAIVPADGRIAAMRAVVVVLFDPVAVPAMRAIVVGKRAGFKIVAHVGSDRPAGCDPRLLGRC